MKFTDTLPEPDTHAQQHSHKLKQRILEAIAQSGGYISFRRYMEMSLYEPGLGYYVSGARKIGKDGDFITAPEISPLFSQCLAQQSREILEQLDGGDILELGAGSGAMAVNILQTLEQQNALPEHYYILDLSPELKQRQKENLQNHLPHLLNKVIWLDQLPENFSGVILGNEVLDAMPVELFTHHEGEYLQHIVTQENQQLAITQQVANESLGNTLKTLGIQGNNYTSEYNPNLQGWMQSIDDSLNNGVMILIDYGYPRHEYYHPERNMGTLICHYQHRVHENPLYYPGLQDITANVDFTAVAETADKAKLDVLGFSTQASFLAASGLETFFLQALEKTPDQQYQLAQQIRTLSLPSEMGEHFKVIALGKNYHHPLSGFNIVDLRHKL